MDSDLHAPQETKKADATKSPFQGFNRVGLLFNGSPGGWPEYSLLSHPKTLILHHEPDQLEFNASITVYRGAARGELAKLPNILHSLIGVDRQVAAGEVSNCG